MLIRPCVLRHTILSTKRGISTSHPIIISKGPFFIAFYRIYFIATRESKIDDYLQKDSVSWSTASGRLSRSRVAKFLAVRSSMSSPSTQVEQVDRLLSGRNDDHGGVIVEMTNEPLDPTVFASLLRASLSQWRQKVSFHVGLANAFVRLVVSPNQFLIFGAFSVIPCV